MQSTQPFCRNVANLNAFFVTLDERSCGSHDVDIRKKRQCFLLNRASCMTQKLDCGPYFKNYVAVDKTKWGYL